MRNVNAETNKSNIGSGKRGLTALLIAQFMGAANDNILKMLLSFAVVNGIWQGKLGQGGQGLIALCLFVPFIFFSGWAGPLADRHSKRTNYVSKHTTIPGRMLLNRRKIRIKNIKTMVVLLALHVGPYHPC